jgi:hypothetical protein
MSKPANMREEMPTTAAFIDDFREAFGADAINASIKKGMSGLPGFFYASENGHQVGTKALPDNPAKVVSVGDMVLESLFPNNQKDHANRNHRR